MSTYLIVAYGAVWLVALYFCLIRNTWVLLSRRRLLFADYPAYQRLPGYWAMVFAPFTWDVRAFLKDPTP